MSALVVQRFKVEIVNWNYQTMDSPIVHHHSLRAEYNYSHNLLFDITTIVEGQVRGKQLSVFDLFTNFLESTLAGEDYSAVRSFRVTWGRISVKQKPVSMFLRSRVDQGRRLTSLAVVFSCFVFFLPFFLSVFRPWLLLLVFQVVVVVSHSLFTTVKASCHLVHEVF